jgi:hypothetical protein
MDYPRIYCGGARRVVQHPGQWEFCTYQGKSWVDGWSSDRLNAGSTHLLDFAHLLCCIASETNHPRKRIYPAGYFQPVFLGRFSMVAVAAITLAAAISAGPASAAMMACTGDNMAKSVAMGAMMQDGPAKTGMMKEVRMANMEMSKGNVRGACMHYMNAQKMGAMKTGM